MVLGAVMVLVLVIVGVASQVRLELKAARGETTVAQSQMLIWSGFMAALQAVRSDPENVAAEVPDPTTPVPVWWTPCTMEQSPTGTGYVCYDFLHRTEGWVVIDATDLEVLQVPVIVRWKLKSSDAEKDAYGWVIAEIQRDNLGNFTGYGNPWVYYDHQWCQPKVPWDPADDNFCRQGG